MISIFKIKPSFIFRTIPKSSFLLRKSPFSTTSNKFTEYEMPTVTWGAIHGRKEQLVSSITICDYLKTLGIIPQELLNLELPSTIPVMSERVQFLLRLGLSIEDINTYPLMLACSLRKNIIPVLAYLEKIGFHRSNLHHFVKSYPQILHSSVIVDLAPVLKFLRGIDVERIDIPYVLQKYPQLLGFKLEGTMSTSVAYLISIGVGVREIGPMVTEYPWILGMRVGTVIKPLVEYLVEVGVKRMIVAKLLEKRSYVMGFDLEERVKKNVRCLIMYGVRKEKIPSVILQHPQILGLPLEDKMCTLQYFFSEKVGMDPGGVARVVEGMPQVVSMSREVMVRPVRFLRDRGFSEGEVAEMVGRCPQVVAVGVEMMKRSYLFFKSEMYERGANELVEFPEFFTYSLEGRVRRRHEVVKRKGVKCSLDWMLNCSDRRFEERFSSEFVEEMDRVYVGPRFSAGGRLELPCRRPPPSVSDGEAVTTLHRRTILV